MSESTAGTMSNCSQSQSVFPPNSLSVHGCLPFSSTMTDTINSADESTMNQDPAYPSTTTTCRPLPRVVVARRSHPRGSGGRFMQERASELRRISLPRTRVNKGTKKDRSPHALGTPASVSHPLIGGASCSATLAYRVDHAAVCGDRG